MMEHVRVSELPATEHATLIAAFKGWNDAADAASWAIKFLINQWDASSFAEIEGEEFYDFTQTRPTIRVNRGMLRRVTWPTNTFYVGQRPADTEEAASERSDVILLLGDEPHFRWRTFAREVLDVARACNVEDIVLLGALVADVPHTAPVQIAGAASGDEYLKLMESAGIERTRYSGPTGILAILQDMARSQSIRSISLWGTAPHYISATPNLPVSEALLRKVDQLKGFHLQLKELSRASQRFTQRVSRLVAEDPAATEYVRNLEERDAPADPPVTPFDASGIHNIPMDGELPTGEQAIEGAEQWLRRIRDE
jgi:proteasome assembly chaperone (PAC2) family protein